MDNVIYNLGLDIGSTTAKAVILGHDEKPVWQDYRRHATAILPCVRSLMQNAIDKLGHFQYRLCVTGSAGMGLAEKFNLRFAQEVIVASQYIRRHFPLVNTLIDVGGEDAKMIFFNDERQPDIRMNGSCAGGTGAFIDQMATLLNLSIEELDALARTTDIIHPVASRCGVFAKTDVQNLISRKVPLPEISRSIFNAVSLQAINTLARGQKILSQIFFSGGPLSFIGSLRDRFIANIGIHPDQIVATGSGEYISALGAADEASTRSETLSTRRTPFLDPDESGQITLSSTRLEPLFRDPAHYTDWCDTRSLTKVERISLPEALNDDLFLGIDAGSTTTKVVVSDEADRIVFSEYIHNNGNTLQAVSGALSKVADLIDRQRPGARISQSAVTGYGEDLIRAAFNIDHGIVETSAHFYAARHCDPQVSFILDIGGQDMKAIFIKHGKITRIDINEACSSGCGSFIEGFAKSLDLSPLEFSSHACSASGPCDLGTRCTVFMNSKVKQSLRENASVGDIASGLAYSVIKNSLYKVLKLRNVDELGDHIVVQGGTFLNDSVFRAMEQVTGRPISRTDIPELMGAYGCALHAREHYQQRGSTTRFVGLDRHSAGNQYKIRTLTCHGCTNSCAISKFTFEGSRHFYTGNKCEKMFSNKGYQELPGSNLLETRYNLLFDRAKRTPEYPVARIGIPRILAMYEQFPFWHTLFTDCGIEVVLSDPSDQRLYELGTGAIMSDNICFPAKVAHGHMENLIARGIESIFYPLGIYERREQKEARNSFNCPIVSSYAEVLRGTLENSGRNEIQLDSPTVGFHDDKLLEKACRQYLKKYRIPARKITSAFRNALDEQARFSSAVETASQSVIHTSQSENRPMVVLAGHPYHNDPMIESNTSRMLSDLGVNVLTVDALTKLPTAGLDKFVAITQWTYPNRLLHAAQWVAEQKESDVHFVMLTSFGCGPDAFLIDEVKSHLEAAGKTFTLIKVDDIASTGSIRLRLRSLVESIHQSREERESRVTRVVQTPRFMNEDRQRTLLFPHFSQDYSPFVKTIFNTAGYKVNFLPPSDTASVRLGLKYSNNEVCYPATVVIGDVLKALGSGDYKPDEVAIGITQTGGQCRATNYIALLRQAIVAAGYPDVPVVAAALGQGPINDQPGFDINARKIITPALLSVMYIDAISQMYSSVAPRELVKGSALSLKQRYIRDVQALIPAPDKSAVLRLLRQAVEDFNAVPCHDQAIPVVGIVGEIFLKYNEFSNANIFEWMVEQGVEVKLPPMLDFVLQYFINTEVENQEHLAGNRMTIVVNKLLERLVDRMHRPIREIMDQFRFVHREWPMRQKANAASKILSLANNFGEGWLIPAEISEFAEHGIHNVVSLQPFGCIANHIIAKGIETRIKQRYPRMNLLFLDFDADVSRVNIHNRLYFMIKNARDELKRADHEEAAENLA